MTEIRGSNSRVYKFEKFFSRFRGWEAAAVSAVLVIMAIILVHGEELWKFSSFEVVELLVLVVVAFFATRNYHITFKKLEAAGEDTDLYAKTIAIIPNIAAFAGATASLKYPTLHLACIVGIYATFCVTNLQHMSILLQKTSGATKVKLRLAETTNWLRDENGPSFAAYILVTFFIAVLAFRESGSTSDWVVHLKAYAAGAATFHLSLSVFRYWRLIGSEDMMEGLLGRVIWNDAATNWLSARATDTERQWKQWLLPLVVLAVIVAGTGYYWIKEPPELSGARPAAVSTATPVETPAPVAPTDVRK